jgi:hypothetical protein
MVYFSSHYEELHHCTMDGSITCTKLPIVGHLVHLILAWAIVLAIPAAPTPLFFGKNFHTDGLQSISYAYPTHPHGPDDVQR